METVIKAIETIYNGYRFRSRLEARWAVFFDAAGIEYEYEPEGFEVKFDYPEGPEVFRYLPDFYLPEFDCYAEVKPNKTKLLEEEEKLSKMIDYSATPISKGLLILGQIPPWIKDTQLPAFIKYYWDSGVDADLVVIEPASTKHHLGPAHLWTVDKCIDCSSEPDLPVCLRVSEKLYDMGWIITLEHCGKHFIMSDADQIMILNRLNHCFDMARQARFEHGEKPVAHPYDVFGRDRASTTETVSLFAPAEATNLFEAVGKKV